MPITMEAMPPTLHPVLVIALMTLLVLATRSLHDRDPLQWRINSRRIPVALREKAFRIETIKQRERARLLHSLQGDLRRLGQDIRFILQQYWRAGVLALLAFSLIELCARALA